MDSDELREFIKHGNVDGVRSALDADPRLANKAICWYLNQHNKSDPLHFVSDCVGNGWLTNGSEGPIASLLLAAGAEINGSEGRESPLIAAASLGAEEVARVLMNGGANLEATSIFGARALHWAAWTGASSTVEMLLQQGAEIEPKCAEFHATPLFWAVHGFGPHGPTPKRDQVGAARRLIAAGARVATTNKEGRTALELARDCASDAMYELLREAT